MHLCPMLPTYPCIYVFVSVSANNYVSIHVSIYLCMCVSMSICIYICTYVSMFTYLCVSCPSA